MDEREKLQHQATSTWNNKLLEGIFLYASETLKLLFMLSAGAAAALVVFSGQLVANAQGEQIANLGWGIVIFLISAFCVCASFGCSYLSQCAYLDGDETAEKRGSRFRNIAIVLVIAAFIAFLAVCRRFISSGVLGTLSRIQREKASFLFVLRVFLLYCVSTCSRFRFHAMHTSAHSPLTASTPRNKN